MLLFDFDISDHLHSRWCRFIIHRYLGHFLERNLALEQLSIDLTKGKVIVQDVNINVQYVNELLTTLNIPLELIDGFIGNITIEVPWMALMADASKVEVSELQLTFQPKQAFKLDDKDVVASMIGSVVESLVSSIEVAKTFQEEQQKEGTSESDSDDGVKAFAQVIDAIVSRFCVVLSHSTIRLENPPQPGSDMCTALELTIDQIEFMDEQMRQCRQEGRSAEAIVSQPHGVYSVTKLNKFLFLRGVSMFTDVFARIDPTECDGVNSTSQVVTSMYIRREKNKRKSSSTSPAHPPMEIDPEMMLSAMTTVTANFQSCYSTISSGMEPPVEEFRPLPHEPDLLSNPVKFGEVLGETRMVVRIQNSDLQAHEQLDNKVEMEVWCKGINVFISPSQVEIVRRFFSSVAVADTSSSGEKKDTGKRMEQKDFDVVRRQLEDTTTQGVPSNNLAFVGNWRGEENFSDFASIPLDGGPDRLGGTATTSGDYATIKSDSLPGKKETTLLRATFGTLLMYITHSDPMSSSAVLENERGYHGAIDELHANSHKFFSSTSSLSFHSTTPLDSIRHAGDALHPADHIRFVGSGVVFRYEVEKTHTDKMSMKLTVNNADCLEFLRQSSCPGSSTDLHLPLLDFTVNEEAGEEEEEERSEHFSLLVRSGGQGKDKDEQMQVTVLLAKCRTQLDMSIVDRISSLLAPMPFFAQKRVRKGKGVRDDLHLSEDLFSPSAPSYHNAPTMQLTVECQHCTVEVKIPMADLRLSDGVRDPRIRKVHDESVQLVMQGSVVKMPLGGDATILDVWCSTITGRFLGDVERLKCTEDELTFLYAGKTMSNSAVTEKVHFRFESDARNKCLASSNTGRQSNLPCGMDDMTRSFSAAMIQSLPKRDGPFSQTHRGYAQDESDAKIIEAGSRREMEAFADECSQQADVLLSIHMPVLRWLVPNHTFLEILYNRLVNDLALWEPCSSGLRAHSSDLEVNVAALQGDCFKECRARDYEDVEGEEEEPSAGVSSQPPSSTRRAIDRTKNHALALRLNVAKGTVLCGTRVMENNGKVDIGAGQIALDVGDAELFVVNNFHSRLEHAYVYFTTSKMAVAQRNLLNTMPRNVCAKDFASRGRDEVQLEQLTTSEVFESSGEDCLALAIELEKRPGVNVKDVLLAIAVRNTQAHFRPVRDLGHHWVSQIAELFTLQDYEIPGYEIPLVATDLHVHLDGIVVGYDHSCVNKDSEMRLRLVLGQADISASLIQNMDVCKFMCIFERIKVMLTNQAPAPQPSVHFAGGKREKKKSEAWVQVAEVGLFQLEVLLSQLADDMLAKRRTPLVEYRCKNDVIKAWMCADSLCALVNMASEIANAECLKPPEEKQAEEEQRELAEEEQSEAGTCMTTKTTHTTLPPMMEKKLQQMVESAMVESPPRGSKGGEVACGTDALEEFNFNLDTSQPADLSSTLDCSGEDDDDYHNRTRTLSTDDEFYMVEDFVGSGITSSAGEPRVRSLGSQPDVAVDSAHFRPPDEKPDGGLLPDGFPQPLIRYIVRDISLHLHLYGGNDLGSLPDRATSWSVDEYREGKGRGQTVLAEARGGPHRDHSACVILELNKVSYQYQMFNRDAPIMCMQHVSIHDVVVRDKLKLSNINEMLYQYSTAEQPRRTCAPMLAVRMVETHQCEGKLRVSLLPIRLNVDQDTMDFLEDFRASVTSSIKIPEKLSSAVHSARPVIEVPSAVSRPGALSPMHDHQPLHALNMDVLTPSPVAPSPLGDLSYLEGKKTPAPALHLPDDAPLTASAISVGALFHTRSRLSDRVDDDAAPSRLDERVEEGEWAAGRHSPTGSPIGTPSPDFLAAEPAGELRGDWASSSEIKFSNLLDREPPCVDDLLMQSTHMTQSIHPDLRELRHSLEEEDRDTICGDAQEGVAEMEEERIRGQTFFKEFTFSPAVSIYLDYQGKNKINMDRAGGAVLGVLKGIGQLNRTEIVLKEISHRNGLLGVGRCIDFAIDEWTSDVSTNLPGVLASCGPISPLVQIGKGVCDLLWLPVHELRKEDGHVVKGLQRGAGSFGLSTAAGVVGIAQSVVGVVQMVAESVLHEVTPSYQGLNRRNRASVTGAAAPTDLRHGMQRAYDIVSDGVRQTRDELELAQQEERASGHSSFRAVLRFATPAVLRPLVMGSQVSYQILGGLRNQLRPDQYIDEVHKYRDEVPGSN